MDRRRSSLDLPAIERVLDDLTSRPTPLDALIDVLQSFGKDDLARLTKRQRLVLAAAHQTLADARAMQELLLTHFSKLVNLGARRG